MMSLLSRWFQPVQISQEYSRGHYSLLLAILFAGAVLRFWGLGNVGLHGDEDIMGLAARGVLEHGVPILPSGLLYPRAPLHVYILAGMTHIFGESEWTLRFPSALVGSICPLLAFFMGKRFLPPAWNLAFAATIAFLPGMIEFSQIARMYMFFVAGLLGFGALLFKWETTGRSVWLAASFLVWLLTLQFHALAIFAAPLFLFPGLSGLSWRMLAKGGAVFLLSATCFHFSQVLVGSAYPEESERLAAPTDLIQTPIETLTVAYPWSIPVLGMAAVLVVVAVGLLGIKRRAALAPAIILLSGGMLACASYNYHAGAVLLLLGAVSWSRVSGDRFGRLMVIGAAVALMLGVQVLLLESAAALPLRTVARVLIGEPNIWPMIRLALFSPLATAGYGLALALAFVVLARGGRVPVHFLFFAMAVWAPTLLIGILAAHVPPRYMLGQLPFFLLCALAGARYAVQLLPRSTRMPERSTAQFGILAGWVALMINPLAMTEVARNDPEVSPDNKGAAEFVRSLDTGPDDLLVAEDSINMTYYLGRVDYRLLNVEVARKHSVLVDGVLRGQYTGTPVIGSGEELAALLQSRSRGNIYVIGSGQGTVDFRARRLGNGIREVLESGAFDIVYEGRDDVTKVWRAARD